MQTPNYTTARKYHDRLGLSFKFPRPPFTFPCLGGADRNPIQVLELEMGTPALRFEARRLSKGLAKAVASGEQRGTIKPSSMRPRPERVHAAHRTMRED